MASFLSTLGKGLAGAAAGYADPGYAAAKLDQLEREKRALAQAKEMEEFGENLRVTGIGRTAEAEDAIAKQYFDKIFTSPEESARMLAKARAGRGLTTALEGERAIGEIPGAGKAVQMAQEAENARNRLTTAESTSKLRLGVPEAAANAELTSADLATAKNTGEFNMLPDKQAAESLGLTAKIKELEAQIETQPERLQALKEEIQAGRIDTATREALNQLRQRVLDGTVNPTSLPEGIQQLLGLMGPNYPSTVVKRYEDMQKDGKGKSVEQLMQEVRDQLKIGGDKSGSNPPARTETVTPSAGTDNPPYAKPIRNRERRSTVYPYRMGDTMLTSTYKGRPIKTTAYA